MNNADLAELRARLRAAGPENRPPPRGPLGALRSLLGPAPSPLLGPPPPYQPRRPTTAPAPPADLIGDDVELVLDQPILPPARREAFGQRRDATAGVAAAQVGEPPADPDRILSIRRARSPLALRIEEAIETPFLPEDLCDSTCGRADRLYAEAGLGTSAAEIEAAPVPSPAEPVLLALERRLLEEHMTVIRALAGV